MRTITLLALGALISSWCIAQQVSPSIYDNGNVGIGTTTPAQKLDVAGTAEAPAFQATSQGVTGLAKVAHVQGVNALATNWKGALFSFGWYFDGTNWIAPTDATNNEAAAITTQFGGLQFYTKASGVGAPGNSNAVVNDATFSTYERLRIDTSGNLGVGTSSPNYKVDVNGSVNALMAPTGFSSWSGDVNAPYGISLSAAGNNAGIFGRQRNGTWPTYTDMIFYAGNDGDERFEWYPGVWTGSGDYLGNEAMDLNAFTGQLFVRGNVGLGTVTPGQKLEVNGSIKLSTGSGGTLSFPDGTIQSTAWTGALCGGDYAESVDVSGERAKYGPGDVLIIDDTHLGKFLKSSEPYSQGIAGVYSTKPGLVGRRQTTPRTSEEIPMGVVGILPVKVTTENGPIHPRDLLVASSKAGYAMKGTDQSRMIGAVIGKAMGAIESGTGVIEVLVNVQ